MNDYKRIKKSLKAFQKVKIQQLEDEMTGWAEKTAGDMKATAPVKTGALKASIEPKKRVKGTEIKAGADYGMYYGGYVEKYRPYIRPSFAKNFPEINRIRRRLGAKKK